MGDQTLFRDPDFFELTYVPEQFDFRDEQLQQLACNFRIALRGCTPAHTILRGLPGTGKTTSVRLLFSEIEKESKRVVPVYVNCKDDKARFSVFATIYNQIFGHYPPTSGVAFRRIYNEIGNYLADNRKVAIVCLDDMNYLVYERTINDILYLLLRIYEEFPGAKIGVVGTVGNMEPGFLSTLDPSVMSVFHPMGIYYPPYGFDEVKEILQQRVKGGLYPGVMPDEVLDLIAGRTEAGGDVRLGLSLLRQSVKSAEDSARKNVLMEDVPDLSSTMFSLKDALGSLSPAELDFLKIIAGEIIRNGGVMTTRDLYAVVKDSLKIGYTSFHKRLVQLSLLKILKVSEERVSNLPAEVSLGEKVGEVLGGL